MCAHTQTKNTAFCTSGVAFIAKKVSLLYKYHKISFCATVHKISSLYKFTQNQFTVQVYTKPIYCTSLHKTSSLYKCTQNQYTVQVYTKPAHCSSLHKTSLLYKCTQNQYSVQVYTKPVYCTSVTNKERNVHGQTILRNVQGRNITKIRAVQTMCKMCDVCKICTKFSVQETSLLYKCTKNQFTVQVYRKPVYCTSVTGQ